MSAKIKILMVDDHKLVREGLKQLLEESGEIVVAAEASNGLQALEEARRSEFDLVLLDISMPGRSGLDLLARLKEEYTNLPVLILSRHPEDQYAIRSIKLGAAGYLTKDSAPDELVLAIRRAAKGGKYITRSLAEKLANYLGEDFKTAPHELLSDREFEILTLLAQGHTLTQIAAELSISINTVSTHRSRILRKMVMENNAQLISYALRNDLI